MSRDVDVIEILRMANPVPPGSAREEPPLGEILGSQLGRDDEMVSTITRPEAGTRTGRRWPKYISAAAAMVVVVGALIPLTRPQGSDVAWGDTPSVQRAVIERVTAAINEGERDAFAAAFAPGGSFSTWVSFLDRPSEVYEVAESDLVETWMRINEVWGLEADLHSCEVERARSVFCDVTIRFHTLQAGLGEEWLFVFGDHGLQSLGMLEAWDSHDGSAPLDWQELFEWESWLADDDPQLLERLRSGEVQTMNGIRYETQPFLYAPAVADEVRMSVDEYLAGR